MSTAIGRDHVVNLVIGHWHPFAVHFDFVMVADHTALSRATVHEVTAGAFAVVSVQLRVEALMPFIVAYPVISFLCFGSDRNEPEAMQSIITLPRA